jgi:hypothetical protein
MSVAVNLRVATTGPIAAVSDGTLNIGNISVGLASAWISGRNSCWRCNACGAFKESGPMTPVATVFNELGTDQLLIRGYGHSLMHEKTTLPSPKMRLAENFFAVPSLLPKLF